MSVEFALQTALFEGLSGSAELSALGVSIYDVPPQSEDGEPAGDFPQIAMGRMISIPLDTSSRVGFDVVIRIHTRSATGSLKECREIQAHIYKLLHREPLAVAGFNMFSLRRESSDCDRDPDRIIHGVCEFRALIETS